MKIGSMILSLSLIGMLLYLAMPVQLFNIGTENQKLLDKYPVLFFPNCKYVTERYNCVSGCIKYEKKCTLNFLGFCLSWEKVCVEFGVKCQERTRLVCEDKKAQPVNPTPPEYFSIEEQKIYKENKYIYKPVKRENEKPVIKTREFTTFTCGGPVIANKYIQGTKYIIKQKIKETCIDNECTKKVISTEIVEDCTKKTRVCRVAYNIPKCYFYPIEVRIDALLQRIGILD